MAIFSKLLRRPVIVERPRVTSIIERLTPAAAIVLAFTLFFVGGAPVRAAGPLVTPSFIKDNATRFYLPGPKEASEFTVSAHGHSEAGVVILTEAIAIKESAPPDVIKHFGEVYAFSPTFVTVYKDQPTTFEFWNLQPDDDHDFMLADPSLQVLMHARLPASTKTSWVFTFHHEGVFPFFCAVHQPEMNGQVLVLPPQKK